MEQVRYGAAKRYLSDAEIAAIRDRWEVERTVDECLTRKLERRRGEDYRCPDLPELGRRLEHWLSQETGQTVAVSDVKRLAGGGSKEMFTFTLRRGDQEQALVLRMNPGEAIVETHRLREFQVMKAMAGTVPVPEMFWVDGDGSRLGQSALVCGFVSGTPKPSQPAAGGGVSGIGLGFPTGLREPVFAQFTDYLAAIHNFDWRNAELDAFDVPEAGTGQAATWNLDCWRRIWEEDCLEAHPVIDLAAQWLAANKPDCPDIRLVHNDYRTGNFLFDEDARQITTILDWEIAHLGDVHEDLAWVTFPGFLAADEQGNPLVCGLAPRDEFLERYEQASGLAPDPVRMTYYEVLNAFKLAVLATASNARAAADRQSHLDAMMNFSTGFGYANITLLADLLRRQGAL